MQTVSPSWTSLEQQVGGGGADLLEDRLRVGRGGGRDPHRFEAGRLLEAALEVEQGLILAADADLDHAQLAPLLDQAVDLGVGEVGELGDLGLGDAFLEVHDQHAVDLPLRLVALEVVGDPHRAPHADLRL